MSTTKKVTPSQKLKLLALDLTKPKIFPRSPRETLGGYVLAGRTLDKCRASEDAMAFFLGLARDEHDGLIH